MTKQSETYFPGGLEVVGVVIVYEPTMSSISNITDAVEKYVPNEIQERFNGNELAVVHIRGRSPVVEQTDFFLLGSDLEDLDVPVTVTQCDLLDSSVVFRLQCNVPVNICVEKESRNWSEALNMEMQRLSQMLCSTACVYAVRDSHILVKSTGVSGMSGDQSCDSVHQLIQSDDSAVTRSKKKSNKDLGPVSLDLFLQVSGKVVLSDVPCCAPVVHYTLGDFKAVKLSLPLDVLIIVQSSEPMTHLHPIFTAAVRNQMEAMKASLCQYRQDEVFHIPEAFHFRPPGCQSIITVVYPKSIPEDKLENTREGIHHLLMLPTDRPLFRRNNAYVFPGSPVTGGYLLNPHAGLSTTGTVGKQYLVWGTYSYHHYMQDRFDDNQWGCAYRSLQTLVSWFRFQGYTDKPIPVHKEIQQALVDVGDKQKNFVGSRNWIGSLEVSFCLDQLIGVTCKIMNVSSGADLASKGRELAAHFTQQGTPIMIGGGVLAHTILGVDFNEVTGDIRFLILDPHYTGSEDLKVILDKGWCGWKGANFWDVNSHYNLCMPQRPKFL